MLAYVLAIRAPDDKKGYTYDERLRESIGIFPNMALTVQYFKLYTIQRDVVSTGAAYL